jgi:hypothetical protein
MWFEVAMGMKRSSNACVVGKRERCGTAVYVGTCELRVVLFLGEI